MSGATNVLKNSRFHFIGIGGIGMCGLAELLHRMGAIVTGSDLHLNPNTEHLQNLGLQVFQGHRAENVGPADVVVYSSAVSSANPEMLHAQRERIPRIPRAEALAEIMRLHQRGIAVAGTHGKTTTTSMTSAIFLHANVKPTIVVGGRLELISSTALLGSRDWMIAEADESDGSFQKLSPEIAIITNIDSDHLDYFKSFENLQKAFLEFAQRVPFYGVVIACGDDLILRKIFSDFSKPVLFYGFNSDNDFVIQGPPGRYSLLRDGKILGEFAPNYPGRHNVLNATAAIIAGLQAGFSFDTCSKGLSEFKGVDRRFHLLGQKQGIQFFDDYGHHPTEIRATLQGFRERFPDKKVRVLFQPHRFTRTQLCWNEFLTCFKDASEVWITDIYPAGEAPIANCTGEILATAVQHPHVTYIPKVKWFNLSEAEACRPLVENLKDGDVFLTLGAGDIYKLGPQILKMKSP